MNDATTFRVLIAGGGVAALEAALALREMVDGRARIALVAPGDAFRLRPLAVAEPFGLAAPPTIPYTELARDLDLELHSSALAEIDPEQGRARTADGEEIGFDRALIATGAVAGEALAGATTYGGEADNAAIAEMLEEIDDGGTPRIAFVVPPRAGWPLPIYELALLTASHAQEAGGDPELTLITHEAKPLDLFGPAASESVTELLRDAGIERVTAARAVGAGPAGVQLADGRVVVSDHVFAGAMLSPVPLAGLPLGPDGWIETDLQMQVDGAPGTYAAGDATWFPVKQGGIAAQQADIAATAIAAAFDPGIKPREFRPVLRGVLFTGGAPRFLRAEMGRRAGTSSTSDEPLWWPPGKVAGPHLTGYLAARAGEDPGLRDLDAVEELGGANGEDYGEALTLALSAADLDAAEGDYRGALRWLDVAESINLSLPAEYARKRTAWTDAEEKERAAEA